MVGHPMKKTLTINTTESSQDYNYEDKYEVDLDATTPRTQASTPPNNNSNSTTTPHGMRGSSDLRSPGITKTPTGDNDASERSETPPLPDFITQTDQYGNSVGTPTPSPQKQAYGVQPLDIPKSGTDETDVDSEPTDACETILESFRMMCCCILPSNNPGLNPEDSNTKEIQLSNSPTSNANHNLYGNHTNIHSHLSSHANGAVHPSRQIIKEDVDMNNGDHDIKLLPDLHSNDHGKKCLVLDLDETLVHSSFRAVPGADFVIPVQIEDVVHFVYVIKRPGVDEFLIEMAKHFELVIYTASLNKYADPLLDLLDPHKTIRYRLFRESCVYYEGSYVKDLSLVNRDLSQAVIVDNSPASYIFHPENAIDCSSFIDDPRDRELLQIGSFLMGVRNVKDVRGMCEVWREWPRIPKTMNDDFIEFPKGYGRIRDSSSGNHEEAKISQPLEV